MSMQPDIVTGFLSWECETCGKSHYVPDYVVGDPTDENELLQHMDCCTDMVADLETVEEHPTGVLGRLSMPGYMDCTDWERFASEEQAEEELQAQLLCDEVEDDGPAPGTPDWCLDQWDNGNRKLVREVLEGLPIARAMLSVGRLTQALCERERETGDSHGVGVWLRMLEARTY